MVVLLLPLLLPVVLALRASGHAAGVAAGAFQQLVCCLCWWHSMQETSAELGKQQIDFSES